MVSRKKNEPYRIPGEVPQDFEFKPAHGTVLDNGAVQVSGMQFSFEEIGEQGQKLIDFVEVLKQVESSNKS